MGNLQDEAVSALIRFPIAALIGAALALRPQRRGTPARQPSVIQTQIIIAIIGCFIMLIVGSNLARAFGVAGAASMIRYQAQIDSPKDAVVLLCALAAGLACGVGLYGLAVVGALFITAGLWFVEGFETHTRVFELTIKCGERTQGLRPQIEGVLTQLKATFELRTAAEDSACYLVTSPRWLKTDQMSRGLAAFVSGSDASIQWEEKSQQKLPK